jgi:hypothetical protein
VATNYDSRNIFPYNRDITYGKHCPFSGCDHINISHHRLARCPYHLDTQTFENNPRYHNIRNLSEPREGHHVGMECDLVNNLHTPRDLSSLQRQEDYINFDYENAPNLDSIKPTSVDFRVDTKSTEPTNVDFRGDNTNRHYNIKYDPEIAFQTHILSTIQRYHGVPLALYYSIMQVIFIHCILCKLCRDMTCHQGGTQDISS